MMEQILGRVSLYYNDIFVGSEFECNIGQLLETLTQNIDGLKTTTIQKRVANQTVTFYSSLDEENDLLETTIKLCSCNINHCRIEESNHKIVLHFKDIIPYERNFYDSAFKFKYKSMTDK